MRKKLLLVGVVVTLLLAVVASAGAITWGVPDGDAHPYVGLLVFDVDGTPRWRCSGTLLSPTVLLTAGHCTYGATAGRVWFESDVSAGRPDNGYPFGGGTSIEFAEIYTHPEYNPNAFFLHDAGIVILSEPVNAGTYGTLADVGLLDQLSTRRGLQEQHFTVVGYGIQGILPNPFDADVADLIRYRATPRLIGTRTFGLPEGVAVVFTNNPGQAARGGTCYGDSGGPVFHGDSNVLVAVTSFGVVDWCVGNGGGYRIDTVDDQAWIRSFLS